MRNSLVQQIGCLQQIFFPSSGIGPVDHGQNNSFGAMIKIERIEISCGWSSNGHFLGRRDFDVKALCNFLRDLTLKREDVFQIAIVFFRPDVRLSASVDQLSINVQPGTCFAHTAFQDMPDCDIISL